jgi:hypothetical protein
VCKGWEWVGGSWGGWVGVECQLGWGVGGGWDTRWEGWAKDEEPAEDSVMPVQV